MPWKNMLIGALLLGLFAVIGGGLVALTEAGTAERITANEREALLANLHALIRPDAHDNAIEEDTMAVLDRELLGSDEPVTIYRARMAGQPVAALIASSAPDGYSGTIRLLVGIRFDGTLAGVRVLSHRETPGLGDAIDITRSNWLLGFDGRSLGNPVDSGWAVKKDGGIFDQFTGATISPRAVVGAVHNTLRYYQQHRDEIFALTALPEEGDEQESEAGEAETEAVPESTEGAEDGR